MLTLALRLLAQVAPESTASPLDHVRAPVDWLATVLGWLKTYSWQLVGAVLTLLLGLWLTRLLVRGLHAMLVRGKVDDTLTRFLTNLGYYAFATLVVIAALGKLGVETGSFVAIVGATGLAIGLALQGSLGNLASGVMIMVFRPFKDGDLILAAGQEGVVEEIQVFATVLNTLDNKKVILPNSAVTSGSITNYTGNPTRRVDLHFAVHNGEDVERIKGILHAVCASVPKVLSEPAAEIEYLEAVPGGIKLVCRPWCRTEDYWPVHFAMMTAVKGAFEREGVRNPIARSETVVLQGH